MLQQDEPEDYIIATGVQHSVREFVIAAAKEVGITLAFSGDGVNEIATVVDIQGDKAPAIKVGDVIVDVNPKYFRPTEVETLLA